MNLELIKENEDGSADYLITNMSVVEQQYLIQKGIIAALMEFIEKEEAEGKLPALLKGKTDGAD
jgi:hypothetical protein